METKHNESTSGRSSDRGPGHGEPAGLAAGEHFNGQQRSDARSRGDSLEGNRAGGGDRSLIYPLYNGEVQLEFDPIKHRYYLLGDESHTPVPSVTTICDTLPKPWLAQWMANCTADYWRTAIQSGEFYDDATLDLIRDCSVRASRTVRDTALAVGTETHTWLEGYLKRNETPEITNPQVQNATNAARAWLSEHEVFPIEIERRVYSREHNYSGTLDKLAKIDGEICVLDWKTNKSGIYPEYLLQTAAYAAAYSEETGTQIAARWLLRIDKETGEPEAHRFGAEFQELHFNMFLAALTIYRGLKKISAKS